MSRLNWGILSTGNIARRFAQGLQASKTGVLSAVASRGLAKAEEFVKEAGIGKAFGSYQELLDDPVVEAVYLAMPHPMHAEWAIRAAKAGKHILCEKPATMDVAEMEKVLETVRERKVFFMEAFMYRCHPQTAKLVELIRSGKIGKVQVIRCVFSFYAEYSPGHRLFAHGLGGGGILDVGSYCVSMARLVAGVALGGEIAEPLEIKGLGRLHPLEKTDVIASALLRFPGDIVAELSCGMELQRENTVTIEGSRGTVTVTQPWGAGGEGARILIRLHGESEIEEIVTESPEDLYSFEIDLLARHRKEGEAPFPAMTWKDTLGNMKVLDAWREQVGVVYGSER